MTKAKKKIEKIIEEQDFIIEETTQQTKLSDEDKLLGKTSKSEVKKVVDYTNRDRLYKVTIHENKKVMEVCGFEVGAFLGINTFARNELKEGARKVVILDEYYRPKTEADPTEKIKYTIEVIN